MRGQACSDKKKQLTADIKRRDELVPAMLAVAALTARELMAAAPLARARIAESIADEAQRDGYNCCAKFATFFSSIFLC